MYRGHKKTENMHAALSQGSFRLPAISRRSFLHLKADLFARRGGRGHELTEGIENDAELGVVLLLHLRQFTGKVGVSRQNGSQLNESAHDGNVDLNCARGVQDAGEHRYALLRKGIDLLRVLQSGRGYHRL